MREPICWIAPRLRCGLGNRLFQVAAAIGCTHEPVLLLPRMGIVEHGNEQLFRILCDGLPVLESANSWVEVEEVDGMVPPISHENRVVLSGFFQNTNNFPQIDSPRFKLLPHLPAYNPPSDSWAIHFRFGDYCQLPHHQVDLAPYYYHCINQLPKQTPLTLFSDSPERLPAIKAELESLGYKADIFSNQDTLETLKAFAACQGAICSNSTFAWWAAFFGWQQSPGYKAYFPDIWIRGRPSPNLFTLPFTVVVLLKSLASNRLFSFS